jgi:NAD(P)-dependent dehydrogenase (short-subunit alcohol dehydrogenase family)
MLQGRTIVVTGANGSLGRAVCAKAQSLGARVLRIDLRFEREEPHCFSVDLTDRGATRACFDALGEFDGLFNLAGGFTMGASAWDPDDGQWEAMFRINVTTLRNAMKAAVPHLVRRGAGSVVNVGAYGAREGQGMMSAYCAAKSTVMRLTESLAEELREQGVNVNAVLPTIIDTPPNRAAMPDADPGRWVAPEDLASVICFLGSEAARAVHGALLPVRGLS